MNDQARMLAGGPVLLVAVVVSASLACSRSARDDQNRQPTSGGGTSEIPPRVLEKLRDNLPEVDRQSREISQRTSFWLVPHPMDIAPVGTAATSPVKLEDLGAFRRAVDEVIVRARVLNDSDRPQLPSVSFAFSDASGDALGGSSCTIERSVLRPRESAPCWASARKGAVSARFDIDLSPQTGVESALERRHDLVVRRVELDRVLTPPGPGMPSQFFFSGSVAPARVPEGALPRVDVDFYAGDVWVGHVLKILSIEALTTKGAEFSGSTDEINLVKAPTHVRAAAFALGY